MPHKRSQEPFCSPTLSFFCIESLTNSLTFCRITTLLNKHPRNMRILHFHWTFFLKFLFFVLFQLSSSPKKKMDLFRVHVISCAQLHVMGCDPPIIIATSEPRVKRSLRVLFRCQLIGKSPALGDYQGTMMGFR